MSSNTCSTPDMMLASIEHDLDLDNLGILDSDAEEGTSDGSYDSLIVRDKVREYLEKEPGDRTDEDIEVLLEFMQHMPAFSNMTLSMRRELCAVMVFAVVESANTVVLNDGEQLDTWSVILNGHVEISKPDGTIEHLHLGDSFGVMPTTEKQYHSGVMTTKVDDCQFVCIAQQNYHQIFHRGEENMVRLEENGEVVMVTEKKELDGGRQGQVILRATPEKLILHLIEDNPADVTYVEDFLLSYRTFFKSPIELINKLTFMFDDTALREKVLKIVMIWVTNHFIDFETDQCLSEFLEKFQLSLERLKLVGHLEALRSLCSIKSCPRSIMLARTNRDDPLSFSLIGGWDKHSGVFISAVDKESKASESGLKRGDQIIEVNNYNFEHLSIDRALEILRSTTHLALKVKSNLSVWRERLHSPDDSSPVRRTRFSQITTEHKSRSTDVESLSSSGSASPSKCLHDRRKEKYSSPAQPSKIRKALLKFTLQRADSSDCQLNHEFSSSHPCSRKSSSLSENSSLDQPLSTSDPDLLSSVRCIDRRADLPDHIILVYRADQSFRYLPIHKETTAREVVMLALTEFGISDPSCNYSLCEVTFEECGIRTKHLPDQLTDLADRCRLNSRYYLKNNRTIETLVPDDLTVGILRDCHLTILQLTPAEIAIQLTLRDFQFFRNIQSKEYIDDLFELESTTGSSNLVQFSELVNEEMFWVVYEVCSEQNLFRRTKIIKHFIKIAKYCRMAKNFNSFFAILSGLGHGSVSRLRQTWAKLSTKYMRLYEEMQGLMDLSRNMSKYRNMLSAHVAHPPVIPFFPLIKKDLTFIHFGNDSRVDGLINFDKLRMIAKEIRQVNRLATGVSCDTTWPYECILSDFSGLSSSVHGTLRHHKKTPMSMIINPKKMYDEALMGRRVRTYLSNLKIIDNEPKLLQMSNLCEPPGKTNMKRSDTQSSLTSDISASSTTTQLFGSSSPTSIRKLMSLSDRIRPVDSRKNVLPLSIHHSIVASPGPLLSSSISVVGNTSNGKRLKKERSLPVVSLSEESSSVMGVKNLGACHNLCDRYHEGKLASQKKQADGNQHNVDSGHSSIASSAGDNNSISSSSSSSSTGNSPNSHSSGNVDLTTLDNYKQTLNSDAIQLNVTGSQSNGHCVKANGHFVRSNRRCIRAGSLRYPVLEGRKNYSQLWNDDDVIRRTCSYEDPEGTSCNGYNGRINKYVQSDEEDEEDDDDEDCLVSLV